MTLAPSWVTPLRAAAAGQPPATRTALELVRGASPALFAGDAVHALTSCFLAALVIAAAYLRSGLSTTPFDLIALLLRTASVAFAVRALLALWLWGRRLARDAEADEHALAWSDEGLFWRAPGQERWLARSDVVGLVVPEARRVLGTSSSLQPLYVVARPAEPLVYWELPPYFAAHAELLAARLERWRLPRVSADAPLSLPALAPDPRYERA